MSYKTIRAYNLGKQYRIGELLSRGGGKLLSETLTDIAKAPIRMVRNIGSPRPAKKTFWALKDINFEVEPGEALGIIGLNGAGKSTLLKLLTRITRPTEGYAEVRGRVSSLLEVGTGFHTELTGRENVYLNGTMLGMKKAEVDRKLDEIVAFAEVEKFIDTPVKRFSTGMFMRLAFSVAAHLEPDILLVDEVLAVGDVAFQKKCLGKMGEVSSQGRTVLFVSHNMDAVLRLVSSCILLEKGRLVMMGEPRDVVDAYLKSGIAREGELVFPQKESGYGQIDRVAMTNSRGELTSLFDHDEDIHCDIRFSVRETGVGHMDIIGLLVMIDGTRLMQFNTLEAPGVPAQWQVGHYRMRLSFPGGILNRGQYVLRPAFNLNGKAIHNHPDFGQGVPFEISENHDPDIKVRRSTLLNTMPQYHLEKLD